MYYFKMLYFNQLHKEIMISYKFCGFFCHKLVSVHMKYVSIFVSDIFFCLINKGSLL